MAPKRNPEDSGIPHIHYANRTIKKMKDQAHVLAGCMQLETAEEIQNLWQAEDLGPVIREYVKERYGNKWGFKSAESTFKTTSEDMWNCAFDPTLRGIWLKAECPTPRTPHITDRLSCPMVTMWYIARMIQTGNRLFRGSRMLGDSDIDLKPIDWLHAWKVLDYHYRRHRGKRVAGDLADNVADTGLTRRRGITKGVLATPPMFFRQPTTEPWLGRTVEVVGVTNEVKNEVVTDDEATAAQDGLKQLADVGNSRRTPHSVVSMLPAFSESCEALQIDPDKRVLSVGSCPPVKLLPWQISAAWWMMKQEASAIQGGILVDDRGLGKTITILSFIYQASFKPAEERSMKPTLILAPAGMVSTWASQLVKSFSLEMPFFIFYGWRSQTSDAVQKSRTLESLEELNSKLDSLDPSDPTTSRTVIISSYSTWAERTLTVVNTIAQPKGRELKQHAKGYEQYEDNEERKRRKGKRKTAAKAIESLTDMQDEERNSSRQNQQPLIYTSLMASRFARVINDEAQTIKAIRTRDNKASALVKPDANWFLSVTYMFNRVLDPSGYLTILHHNMDYDQQGGARSEDEPEDVEFQCKSDSGVTSLVSTLRKAPELTVKTGAKRKVRDEPNGRRHRGQWAHK